MHLPKVISDLLDAHQLYYGIGNFLRIRPGSFEHLADRQKSLLGTSAIG